MKKTKQILKVVFLLLFSENKTMWHLNYKTQTIDDTLIVLTIDSDGNKQIFTCFFYRKIVHNAETISLTLLYLKGRVESDEMLIPPCAGSKNTDSGCGGGLYFTDILLNISFLRGLMDIRMFHVITFCQGDNHPGKNFVKAVKLMAWRQAK